MSSKKHTTASISGLDATWTPVATQCGGRSQTGLSAFVSVDATTTGIVTATLATASSNAVITVAEYSGVDLASPIGAVNWANTNGVNGGCDGGIDSASFAMPLTTTSSSSLVVGAVALRSRSATPSPGWDKRIQVMQGSGGGVAGMAIFDHEITAPAAIIVDGTTGRDVDWAVVAIELKAGSTFTADFGADVSSGDTPLTVAFTDLTSGTPTSWSWDFGDAGSSTDQNPTHTYTTVGTYAVTLISSNGSATATKVKSAYITVTLPPPPQPDLVITEIDPGDYIELTNTTGADIDLSSAPYVDYRFCSPFEYMELGAAIVPAGGSAQLPWPGNFDNAVDAAGEFILYSSTPFSNSDNIADFVAWGPTDGTSRLAQAVSVGRWGGGPAPAIPTDGVIRRLAGTDGFGAASYEVVAPPDVMAPIVVGRDPVDAAVDVAFDAVMSATFDEDVVGVDTTSFVLTDAAGPVAASVSYDPGSFTATLDPDTNLDPSTAYTATLTSAITDLAAPANALVATSWSFTIADPPPPGSASIGLAGSAVSATVASGDTVTLPAWAPGADELLLVLVAVRDESRPVSVSGNGVVWNELTDVDNVQGQGGFTVFWAQDPTPVAGAVTVTVTGNSRPVSVVGQRFGGVDPAGPIEAFSTNAGPLSDNNDMLESVTTISPEAWVVGAAWHRGRTLSLPAGETEIAINELAGSGGSATRASMWYQGPNPTPGSVQLGELDDMSGTHDWAMTAIALKPL